MAFEMLAVTGRLLDTPKLRDGRPACNGGVGLPEVCAWEAYQTVKAMPHYPKIGDPNIVP